MVDNGGGKFFWYLHMMISFLSWWHSLQSNDWPTPGKATGVIVPLCLLCHRTDTQIHVHSGCQHASIQATIVDLSECMFQIHFTISVILLDCSDELKLTAISECLMLILGIIISTTDSIERSVSNPAYL